MNHSEKLKKDLGNKIKSLKEEYGKHWYACLSDDELADMLYIVELLSNT